MISVLPGPIGMTNPPPESDQPAEPPIPSEIGGYRIQRVLGRGGMATVYAAMQERPRRTVALKVLRAGDHSSLALRRFRREVEILGKLRHPFIAQVYEAGTHVENGVATPYLVMEYVPRARTILEYAAAEQFDLRARLKLFAKVCAAVEHGHRRKVIHRDLKPGNILVDESGQPKVIDFGVSRAADLGEHHQTLDAESGRIVGTIQYMSPEQLDPRPRDLDAGCDVYALGVILYKLVTGQMPHDLTSLPVHVAARVICEDDPRPPSALRPEARGDLDTIILKALAKDRFQRYRNAGSLGRDVLRLLGDRPVNARPAGPLHRWRLLVRRQRPVLAAVGVAAVVLAAAGGGLAWVTHRRGEEAARLEQEVERERGLREQAEAVLRERAADEGGPGGPGGAVRPRTPFALTAGDGGVESLAFDPAGTRLLSGGADGTAVIWDLVEQVDVMTLDEHDAAVATLAFDRDDDRIILGGADGAVVLLDVRADRLVRRIPARGAVLTCLAVSPAGDRLAIGRDDLTIRLFDDQGGEPQVLRSSRGAFRCVAFNHAGDRLAAGTDGGGVYLWETASKSVIGAFRGVDSPLVTVGFVGETNRVAALHADGHGVVWSATGSDFVEFNATGSQIAASALDPGGTWIVITDGERIEARRLDDPTVVAWRLRPGYAVRSVAIDAVERWVAAGGEDGRIDLWPID
jgi:hypothetical protein